MGQLPELEEILCPLSKQDFGREKCWTIERPMFGCRDQSEVFDNRIRQHNNRVFQ